MVTGLENGGKIGKCGVRDGCNAPLRESRM